MTCPDANTIADLISGHVAAELHSELEAHLAACASCRRLVGLMAGDSELIVASDAATISELAPRTRLMLSAGETVGRYRIERVIGAGAMGVVYAARDPELDREIALKVLPPRGGSLPEAKAMARLRHPNVVAVHDVGLHGDDVFIAMEYVAGETLRDWLRTPRSTQEILHIFTQAGRGLAAAHAAGIVHRDFKPENVLVDAGAIAKVTDFGLARLASDSSEHTASAPLEHAPLVHSASFAGTPAYMAPEQLATAPIDGRADQFAFCVSLYEALYGRRPFPGDSVTELAQSIAAGKLASVRGARVPSRIRRALLRGLSADRQARFATMDALVDALSPRRQRLAVAAVAPVAAAAIAGLAVTVAVTRRAEAPPCRGATAEINSVWNVTRRTAVHAAFVATHAPRAAEIAAAVERSIDDFAGRWTATQTGACEATRVHRQQSEAVLDLRTACLQRRRSELDALLTVFARADQDVVTHARDALGSLELAACNDSETLARQGAAAPPRDPIARARYDGLRARIDRVRMLLEVTHFDEAERAVATIDAAEFAALAAETEWLRGKTFKLQGNVKAAEPALFKALTSAQALRDLHLVALAAVDLANLTGYEDERTAEGERWVALAASTIEAAGGHDVLSVRLQVIHAGILERAGRVAEAEQIDREALQLVRRKGLDDHLEAEVLDGLGANLAQHGKLDDAIVAFKQALAIRVKRHGEVHQLVTSTRMNLANALASSGKHTEALEHFQAALAGNELLSGPDGSDVARVLGNMGMLQQEMGRLDEARRTLDRALAIREKLFGADHPSVARIVTNLGYVELDAKDFKRALAQFERASGILERALGANHPAQIDVLGGIGAAWLGLGKPADAIAPLEHAIELREQYPADPGELSDLRAALAKARSKIRKRR